MDYKKILELGEKYRDDVASFLSDIVPIKSLSGEEGEVVERIKKEMEKLEFDDAFIDPLGNVIGRIGDGPTVIAFDGHVDTVDAEDLSAWDTPPFEAKIIDGKIYGRGSCDQKGGVASLVYGGRILKDLGLYKDFTFYFVGSVMEEDSDGLPWLYILNEDKITPEIVVLTEPTNLKIARGHRGRMEIGVKTYGLSAHASAPERGVNAIYKMASLILDIEKLNEQLKDDEFLGKGTVAVTEVRSKSPSLCAVPYECTIHLDRRLTQGEDKELAISQVKALLKDEDTEVFVHMYERPSHTGLVYPMEKYYPTWTIPADHPAVKGAVDSFKGLFASDPIVDKWVFSTNGVAIKGLKGIDCIGFGPGNEIYAHAPNEFTPINDLVKAMEFYAAFPLNYKKYKEGL